MSLRSHCLALMPFLLLAVASCTTVCGAGPQNVLVIINDKSPASKEIGAYYVTKRKIPAKNVVRIKCPDQEAVTAEDYEKLIKKPVKDYITKAGLKTTVDYLVLTKGVPMRLSGGKDKSVDGLLMCMDRILSFDNPQIRAMNPYFDKSERFSHKKFGIYLATRLDGYTVKDAKALVDRSLAAKPSKGLFLFDTTPKRNTGGYLATNLAMERAHNSITAKGYRSELDKKEAFVGGRTGLMGYYSWGSNDASFDLKKYKSNRFLPGAIAETAVSTSARTLKRVTEGQSVITDLIEAGVTGVKGYITEPTLAAVADPKILFDRYVSGYTLAESFYAASRFIFWRDIVIGDPLCAPYAGNK